MERTLHRVLKPYLSGKLKALTKADIQSVLEPYQTKPAALRTLFAALRPFFNDCIAQELISSSPLASIKTPLPVPSRDRTLTKGEIKTLWEASYHPSIPNVWGAFYRLLLLTGQRREEVSGMSWSEIDLVSKTWTIPKERSKNGKAHIVHLSPLALHELSLCSTTKGFVFPAQKLRNKQLTEAHISGYSQMKAKLDGFMASSLNGAPFTAWRVHDLRRTLASGLAEYGFPTDVVDRLLNHVSGSQGGIKGVYQRYSFLKEREEAINVWSDIVGELTRPWVRRYK